MVAVTRTSDYICRYKTRKLVKIMDNDYYIAFVMVSGEDSMSIALLRPLNLAGELSGQEVLEEPTLALSRLVLQDMLTRIISNY